MSNYNQLKLTYADGRQESITLTGNTIEQGEYQYRNIAAVEVPEIVEVIMDYAFCDQMGPGPCLNSIKLNEGLRYIGSQAFQHGTYSAITIPSTVEYIGVNAFNIKEEQDLDQTGNLTVTCLATTPPEMYDYEEIIFGDPEKITAIYVPADSVDLYKAAEYWSNYEDKIQALLPNHIADIASAYIGDTLVDKIYLGDVLVYGGEEPVYSAMPLTFEVISAGTINLAKYGTSAPTRTVEVTLNGGESWTSFSTATGDSRAIQVQPGDKIQFRGNNTRYSATGNLAGTIAGCNYFGRSTAKFKVYGNILSLVNSTGYQDLTALTTSNTFLFTGLFYHTTGLTDASNLVLPAIWIIGNQRLPDGCYERMFEGCTSLSAIPTLPDTLAGQRSHRCMFKDCTSLVEVPDKVLHDLMIMTAHQRACSGMFQGCTSLVKAPELPQIDNTTLATDCVGWMFAGCTSLTDISNISLYSTRLGQSCYQHMFEGCTSLTTAPALPATTLSTSCYQGMFSGCTSLTAAPALPATTLATSCYTEMFADCTSLTTAPALPATTLAQSCYNYMFCGCTSLATAPVLPATTLANSCYSSMFAYCTSLNSIICLATDISASECTGWWVSGVASTGTFYKNPDMSSWTTGISGIPAGWTVEDYNN